MADAPKWTDFNRLQTFTELSGFRGLWFTKRSRAVMWSVTYLRDGEFWETEEWPTWREAVDEFAQIMGLDEVVEIAKPADLQSAPEEKP